MITFPVLYCVFMIMLTTTTINIPYFLEGYIQDSIKFGFKDSIDFLVIADRKTPSGASAYVNELNSKYKVKVLYWDNDYTKYTFPQFNNLIPDNSGVRRMIAHFFAIKEKYDCLISVDDDNFISDENYFLHMSHLGIPVEMLKSTSMNKFTNIYDQYNFNYNFKLYHRGFPFSQRNRTDTKFDLIKDKVIPVIKNSSVLGDPDIDAISRLIGPVNIEDLPALYKEGFALDSKNWTPFNNQSTSFHSSILPAYFTPEAGGRNADIWSSYVMCKLVELFDKNICIGKPIVTQNRNPHDYLSDLENEILNMKFSNYFTTLLASLDISGSNYLACLQDIIIQSKKQIIFDFKTKDNYMYKFFSEYQLWVDIVSELN